MVVFVFGTLLGPEATGPRVRCLRLSGCPEPSSEAHVLRWELMGGTFDMVRTMRVFLSTSLRWWERGGFRVSYLHAVGS